MEKKILESFTADEYRIERYEQDNVEHIQIINPDGSLFDRVISKPEFGMDLELILNHHKG